MEKKIYNSPKIKVHELRQVLLAGTSGDPHGEDSASAKPYLFQYVGTGED